MPENRKKIFIGITNTAGVCSRLKHGFDSIGVESDFYSFKQHTFKYPVDQIIEYSEVRLVRIFQKIKLTLKLLFKYNYFIYVTPHTLFPNYMDIKILKFFGKKTMMVFTGCDVRIPEKVAQFKWNPCSNCTQEYKDLVGCVIDKKIEQTKIIEKLFDIISCPIEANGNLSRKSYPGYFPVDLTPFPADIFENYTFHKPLRILHSPTNETYKGSKYIYEIINKLKEKYEIDFKVIKNVSIDKLYKEMANSDIIIDQMLLGSWGFVSIEAMALYKPVICYMRNEIWDNIKRYCPIINANPDTLYNTLSNILENPEQLKEISKRSRKFVENFWEEKKVAEQYYRLFEDLKN